MSQIIQIRHDTTINWAAADPVLAIGEIGTDTDLAIFKIGDGVLHWSNLPIANQGARGLQGDGMTQAQILKRMI